jgi:hypothetical protein
MKKAIVAMLAVMAMQAPAFAGEDWLTKGNKEKAELYSMIKSGSVQNVKIAMDRYRRNSDDQMDCYLIGEGCDRVRSAKGTAVVIRGNMVGCIPGQGMVIDEGAGQVVFVEYSRSNLPVVTSGENYTVAGIVTGRTKSYRNAFNMPVTVRTISLKTVL